MLGHIRGVNGPILGKFRLSALTGLTTGLAAGATIFSARFAPADGLYGQQPRIRALITDLRIKAAITVPFTAANEISAQAFIARAFTASDTGGTALLPTGIQQNLSSIDLGYTTAFTDMRIATAAALAAGTRTLDPSAILNMPAAQPGTSITAQANFETALETISDQQFMPNLQGQTGGVAANAEGLVVTLPVAQGAGGVVRYAIELGWIEYCATGSEQT